jgi:DNA (cytosine-5)-methyltransferase 1
VLFADETEASPRQLPTLDLPLGFYWTEGRSGVGLTVDGIPPLKVGSGVGIASAPAVLFPDGSVRTPGITACERLQGYPEGWTKPAANGSRYPEGRLVGNAVSVPVARWVAERIKSPRKVLDLPIALMSDNSPWPSAAFNVGTGRYKIEASENPVKISCGSIVEYLDDSWKPLSERALRGFVRRAREGNLSFPEGFLSLLDAAIDRSIRKAA